jgi:hypothetical protein
MVPAVVMYPRTITLPARAKAAHTSNEQSLLSMVWDPALFVFLFYRSMAEREQASLREARCREVRELPQQPTRGRKRSGTAEARAQAIWSRRADTPRARAAGTALAQVIKLPRR